MSDIYIEAPLDTDPQDLLDDCYTYLAANIPGWEPTQGQLDVWILMAFASLAAETRDVASIVPASIFRWFGANLVSLPPQEDVEATCTTTWTAVDDNGYTVPAGTQIAIEIAGASPVPFLTTFDAVIAPGSTSISGVPTVAVTPGSYANGIGVINGAVDLLDALTFISGVTQDDLPTGGLDAETDSSYLNRLAAELQLLAPRPILAPDFAIFSRNVTGVYRAAAIDLLKGDTLTPNTPRCVTVGAMDDTGAPIGSTVKATLLAYLQAAREQNFLVYVNDPVVELIDVTCTVKAQPGADHTAVQSAVNDAITAFLNPLTWGNFNADANPQDWNNITTLRYNALLAVIGDADGVQYVTSMTMGVHGGALAGTDIVFTDTFPLPDANTLTITVT